MKNNITAALSFYSRRSLDRLVMRPCLQRILYYIGKELQVTKWVFIIGCYNSATTLLTNILRQHPKIGGLHTEGAFLTDSLPYPEQFGFPRMWAQCMDKIRIEPGLEGRKKASRIKRHWSLWYRDNKPILAEKSVSNAVRIPFLNEHFNPAYFIYIVRNGYAVSKGIQLKANLKRWNSPYKHTGYPIEMCAEQWRLTDEVVEQDKQQVDNLLRIYYEDLVSDPVSIITNVTDFLNIFPMPNKTFEYEFSVHGSESAITNMNETAFARLEDQDCDKIENVAGDVLLRHGYLKPKNQAS